MHIYYREVNSDDSSVIEALVQTELISNGLAGDYLSKEELNLLRRLSRLVLVTTASILGSFLSQEVIKGISRAGIPAFNVFVFDSNDFVAKAFPIN